MSRVDATLLQHLAALADPAHRAAALETVAGHVGARAVTLFIPHPDVATRLIPAPGAVRTLPSRRGWQELLDECAAPGSHQGRVAFPTVNATVPAVAYAYAGVTIVCVGHDTISPELDTTFAAVAPLLSALLAREQEIEVAGGELAIAREATQRATALATALDLARLEAERATRIKDEFLAMLGHELRNPLAPIVTALHMLKREGGPIRIHEILDRQVAHLMRLVDDLLDVSRITRGKIELRREHVELASVVTRALEMTRPLLAQRRNRLVVDVAQRGLGIHGDPARLAQIVSNLVTNAAKYSEPDSRIRIAGERAGSCVRLSVEDEGIGIEAEFLDRVFDQFLQISQGSEQSAGGLGLGLAIVKSLAAMHGGTVRALSEGRGRGATFVVELPHDEGAATVEVPERTVEERSEASACVLLVDDNHDAAELLAEVLTSFGYDVRVVHSGPDALEAVTRFTPDIGLLDIGLPVMDGYELARALRTVIPRIRLVAVTGYGQAHDRERALDAGFDAHLVKPVSIYDVTETLHRLLH